VLPPSISVVHLTDALHSKDTDPSLPIGYLVKQQKFLRRRWRRWKQHYMTVQQQMWMALQILVAEPNELHFSEQLRVIAIEFSFTTECSDTSAYIDQQQKKVRCCSSILIACTRTKLF